jgi:HK97 family phage major capsid protein
MPRLSDEAILEISELSAEAERLARGTGAQRKRADILLARISTIRQVGLSSSEARFRYTDALVEATHLKDAEYRAKFDRYVNGLISDHEMRAFLSGQQSLTATEGTAGGFLVPMAYDGLLREAMRQTDPVLSADSVSFTMTDGPSLRPETVSGFDLSTVSAQIIGETMQQNPQAIPTVAGGTLRSDIIFKVTFASSWESEADIVDFPAKITRAAGVALARKIGGSVVNGHGGTDIAGMVQAIGGPYASNATSGKIVLTDLTKFYFGVDRFYRAAPLCGWMVDDGTYQLIREATDNSGRPLLSVEKDEEMLLGKPLRVSPSLGTAFRSLGIVGSLLFGDLSHVVVRCSRPVIQYSIESGQADITAGMAAWIARARADAVYFDPSAGANPPIILAAIS